MLQQLLHRFTQLTSCSKRSYLDLRLRPSSRFRHFLDRRVFTINHQQRLLIFRRQNREQSICQVCRDQTILDRTFIASITRMLVQPARLIFGEIGNRKLRSPFRSSHHIQTSVGRDSRQPTFKGAATFKAPKLRKCFQKNFLRRFLNQTPLPEKPACHTEHSRAVAPDYLREGRLITGLRLMRQV